MDLYFWLFDLRSGFAVMRFGAVVHSANFVPRAPRHRRRHDHGQRPCPGHRQLAGVRARQGAGLHIHGVSRRLHHRPDAGRLHHRRGGLALGVLSHRTHRSGLRLFRLENSQRTRRQRSACPSGLRRCRVSAADQHLFYLRAQSAAPPRYPKTPSLSPSLSSPP